MCTEARVKRGQCVAELAEQLGSMDIQPREEAQDRALSSSSGYSNLKLRMREYRKLVVQKLGGEVPPVQYNQRAGCVCCATNMKRVCGTICTRININCFGTMYVRSDEVSSRAEGAVVLENRVNIIPPPREENRFTNASFYLELYSLYGDELEYIFPVAINFLPRERKLFWENWNPQSQQPLKASYAKMLKRLLSEASETLKKIRVEMMAEELKDFYRRSPPQGRFHLQMLHPQGTLDLERRAKELEQPPHAQVKISLGEDSDGSEDSQPFLTPQSSLAGKAVDVESEEEEEVEDKVYPQGEIVAAEERSKAKQPQASTGIHYVEEPALASSLPGDQYELHRTNSYEMALGRLGTVSEKKVKVVAVEGDLSIGFEFDRERVVRDVKRITHATEEQANEVADLVLARLPSEQCSRQVVWDKLMEACYEKNIEIKETVDEEVSEVLQKRKYGQALASAKRAVDIDTETLATMIQEIKEKKEKELSPELPPPQRGWRHRVINMIAARRLRPRNGQRTEIT